MWPLKSCAFFVSFVCACALSLVYPIVGIVNYMMVYQTNPDQMWWGAPLRFMGIRYSMTAAVCLILGMIISGGRVPKTKGFVGGWLLLMFMFTAIVLSSPAFGVGSTHYGDMLIEKMVKMAIFLACLARMGSTCRNFKLVLWALVSGSLLLGYDAYGAPPSDFFSGRLNFVGASDFRESSGLGAHMAAMLPLLGMAFLVSRTWLSKGVAAVSGILSVNTIILCRTRSAFVGLLAGAAVAVVMAPRARRRRVWVALIVGGLGAYALTDDFFWTRISTAFRPKAYSADLAIQSRVELWEVAGAMFLDYPFGVGVGQFRETLKEYKSDERKNAFTLPRRVTHNTYLLCATELGAQGAVVFGAMIALSLLKLRRCARLAALSDDPAETRLLTYGVLLSVVIYLVAAAFTDRLYTESFWWVLALPVCLEGAVTREAEARMLSPALSEDGSIADVCDGYVPGPPDRDARCALG